MFRHSNTVQVLFCDWEGTLIDVNGRIEAGVRQALPELPAGLDVVVASNAGDGAETRASLDVAGYGRSLTFVATAGELGAAKPSSDFYRSLLKLFAVKGRRAAMVGDDYVADVVGAKGCGLRAYWYNPACEPCPLPHPVHDGELSRPEDLPRTVAQRPLPDVADCMFLLLREDGSLRVVRHSLTVAVVAFFLAERLRACGLDIDPLLVHRGALLHDLDKVATLQGDHRHGELAALWLRRAGQRDLASIAQLHVAAALLDHPPDDLTWEAKVVHYADKLVEEDRIVGLEERWNSLLERYPRYQEVLEEAYPEVVRIGDELAAHLGRTPEEMLTEITAALGSRG